MLLKISGSTTRILAHIALLVVFTSGGCCRSYVGLSPTFDVADPSGFTGTTIELLVVTAAEYEAIFKEGRGTDMSDRYWGPTRQPKELRDLASTHVPPQQRRLLTLDSSDVTNSAVSADTWGSGAPDSGVVVELSDLIAAGREKWNSEKKPKDAIAMYLVVVARTTAVESSPGLDVDFVALDSDFLKPEVVKSRNPRAIIELKLDEGQPVIRSVRAVP